MSTQLDEGSFRETIKRYIEDVKDFNSPYPTVKQFDRLLSLIDQALRNVFCGVPPLSTASSLDNVFLRSFIGRIRLHAGIDTSEKDTSEKERNRITTLIEDILDGLICDEWCVSERLPRNEDDTKKVDKDRRRQQRDYSKRMRDLRSSRSHSMSQSSTTTTYYHTHPRRKLLRPTNVLRRKNNSFKQRAKNYEPRTLRR
jgi:hypothetical protein